MDSEPVVDVPPEDEPDDELAVCARAGAAAAIENEVASRQSQAKIRRRGIAREGRSA